MRVQTSPSIVKRRLNILDNPGNFSFSEEICATFRDPFVSVFRVAPSLCYLRSNIVTYFFVWEASILFCRCGFRLLKVTVGLPGDEIMFIIDVHQLFLYRA